MEAAVGSAPKAERILNAMHDLLLRRGSRGVTVSEVARLANVGKGTVYLYWNTKEDLIIELFVRDFLAVLDEVIATVVEKPLMIVPHELFPLMQRTLRKRPFLTALRTRDYEVLGLLIEHPRMLALIDAAGPATFLREALPVLRDHGIVRTDLSLEAQLCATTAILDGFFSIATAYSWSRIRDVSAADADAVLSKVFQLVLEPAHSPAPDNIVRASPAVVAQIRKMRAVASSTAINARNGLS